MRLRNLVIAVTLVAVATVGSTKARSQAAPMVERHVMVAPEEITWQPIPPSWADGPPPSGYTLGHSEVAIIEGEPDNIKITTPQDLEWAERIAASRHRPGPGG